MSNFKAAMQMKAARTGLLLNKHKPEILLGVGLVSIGVGTVLACRATLKAKEILETAKDELEIVAEVAETQPEEYTEDIHMKDRITVYTRTTIGLAKTYLPAALFLGTGATMVICGNNVARQRAAALAAAYTALDVTFKKYRGRVVEKHGQEEDIYFMTGEKVSACKNPELGEDAKEFESKRYPGDEIAKKYAGMSQYAVLFDELNPNWNKDRLLNIAFLKQTESYFNCKLMADGHVFLNDVYKALGIHCTPAGQIVGWVYDDKNPEAVGDNFIDFGILKFGSDFVNGIQTGVMLDFNVDGVVYDLI